MAHALLGSHSYNEADKERGFVPHYGIESDVNERSALG